MYPESPGLLKPTYPTLKQSWGVLGWYLLLTLTVGVPVYFLLLNVLHAPKSITGAALTVLTEVALFLLLLRKAGGLRQNPVQLTGQELPWLYMALPLLVLVQAVLLSSLLEFLHLPNIAEASFRDLVKHPVLAFVVMCVAAPVLEELTFRGIILKGLLRNYHPWVAIGQSALLFGLIHLNPLQIVGAGIIGLLVGWLYYRTQSLWLCIAAHALNNFYAFLVMSTPTLSSVETTQEIFPSTSMYLLAVVLSGCLLGLLLWRVKQVTTPIDAGSALTATRLTADTAASVKEAPVA